MNTAAEYLYVEVPDLLLDFHNLGPDVLVNIAEEPNNIQFVQQFSGLVDDYNGRSHMGKKGAPAIRVEAIVPPDIN